MRNSVPTVVAVVFALALADRTASAGDPPDAAATHAEAGKAAFAEERYADAIAEFRAANAIEPDPKLVYAIAQAQRLAGDCPGAIASYQEFLAARPDAKLAEYSQANIDRCEKELAKQGKPVVEPAPPADPAPMPLPVGPEPRDGGGRSWTSDWLGHALVGGGVAAASVGTVLWLKGRTAARAANDATDHASFLEARDAASSALTFQRVGIAAAIAGGALIVGGVFHYTTRGSSGETRVTAVPLDGGAAVVVGGPL